MDRQYFYNKYQDFKTFLPTLITSLLILVVSFIIATYYKNHIINSQSNKNKNISLLYLQISSIVYYIIICIGIIFTASNLGFNVAAMVTILGTFGIASGIALQSSLQNIISGIFISIFKLFNIGDVIKLFKLNDLYPTTGRVIDFNLGYTVIKELKTNVKTIIPNSIVYGNLLTNYGIREPE